MRPVIRQPLIVNAQLSVVHRLSSVVHRNSAGFTLIEVLISLAILTVILGAVYTSFFTVQRALERYEDISLKYHEVRTALDIMRREIEGALYKSPYQTGSAKVKTFFVAEDRDLFGKNISRLYLTAFSFRGSGTSAIAYHVREKDGELVLVKIERPATVSLEEEKIISYFTEELALEMVEGIESFTVEIKFGDKWVKTWNTLKTKELPEVVRVTIEFDDKGKKVKLTEYAKPKVGTNL